LARKVQFGDYKFRFRVIPTLLLALPAPLFAGLGIWQLERADEKRALMETLSARDKLPPLVLRGLEKDPAALRYRKVEVSGQFESADQFFIENRRLGGKTGFHVITPLRLAGSDVRLLVNRGWVQAGPGNGLPENVETPKDPVHLVGVADVPSLPAMTLGGGDSAAGWGKRWPYMTTGLFAATVNYPLQPFVLLQDPDSAHGFVRQWPREMPKEAMHIGYAIQWFAFALIAFGLYLKLSLERTAPREQSA
jgi:surfeit locus 1 family protein